MGLRTVRLKKESLQRAHLKDTSIRCTKGACLCPHAPSGLVSFQQVSQQKCAVPLWIIFQRFRFKFASKDKRPIDGMDLMPVIRGEVKKRTTDLFFGYRRLHAGVDGQALISGNWKLLREAKPKGRVRLYDLAKDPHEEHDLAKTDPVQLKLLMDRLQTIDRECQLSRDGADFKY